MDAVDLLALRQACLAVAGADTAYQPSAYRPGTLVGHCGVVAYAVQAYLGGAVVTGRVQGERHLWNRLPGGVEVDLTSDQYGGDGLRPRTRGRALPPRRRASPRAARFAQRLARVLNVAALDKTAADMAG